MVLSKISPSSWSQSRKPIMCWIVSASCERRSRCTAAHPQRAGWSAVELNRGWWWWQWWWDSCDSSIIASFPCLFQLLSKRQPFICRVLFSRPSPGPFLWEELWGDNYPPSSLSCLRCKCQENIRGKKKRKKENLPGTRGRTEWLHIRTTMCKMCKRVAPLWHRHESSFFVFIRQD